MKKRYKGCDIEVTRQDDEVIEYIILDNGLEVDGGFIDSRDDVYDIYNSMKFIVDNYRRRQEEDYFSEVTSRNITAMLDEHCWEGGMVFYEED